jgi:pilus assembly protein CpaB
MKNKRLNGIVVAVVLALVGTLLLVGYVNSAEARATKGEKMVPVLVVRSGVRAGTDAEDVKQAVAVERVPAKVKASDAVVDLDELDDLDGKVTAVALVPGEQLLSARFVEPAVQRQGDIPAGLHQVTLSLDPERALGGHLGPGYRVGVVASYDETGDAESARPTTLLLDEVLVTGVQAVDPPDVENDDEEQIGTAPDGALLVTLAVDRTQLEQVVDAAEHGSVWLSAAPAEAGSK